MYVGLIQNAALLVALSTLYSLIARLRRGDELRVKLLKGLLFGTVAVAGMKMPFHYAPGIIYDGRSIILAMAGLFGGGTSAAVSMAVAGAYRAHLGGTGVLAGIATIVACPMVGLAFRRAYGNRPEKLSILSLYGFGISAHVAMLACQLLLPWPTCLTIISRIWLPVMLIFPVATVLMGLLLGTEERHIQANLELAEREALLKKTQSISRVGSWESDIIHNKLTWSDETYRIFGLSPGRSGATLETFHNVVHPDDLAAVDSAYQKSVEERRDHYEIQYRIIRQDDGQVRTVFEKCEHIKDASGRVVRSIGFVQDITELKQAEEALKQSEEKYRILVENAHELILVAQDAKIKFINSRVFDMLGYRPEEVIEKPFIDFIHAEDRKLVAERYAKRLKGEYVPDRYLFRIVSREGETRWFEITAVVIEWEGRPATFNLLTDVTERKQAEEESRKLQAQFIQAQKMESVGRLAGGVAHDFNNMLSIILGYSEMMLDKVEPGGPLYQDLQEIMKAAKHSADVVRQLLTFARKQTIAPKVLDLNDTVEGLLKMLRRLITEDIELAWLPGTNLWPVEMDPGQVNQILANLCVNARDAIKGVGKIIIETKNVVLDEAYCKSHVGSVPGQYVMLAVTDDGCGMDKETLEKIFEPFFTTKEVGEGTGLGLSTVYGIVKQNEGYIEAYSEPGKGTTFKIYLKRYRAQEEEEPPEEKAAIIAEGRGKTVLLVEDEVSLLNLVKKMLEGLNYTVLTAAGPAEALEAAAKHSGEIHLLMTDVVMPEMSGKDLAARIREVQPGVKILFMSGYTANIITDYGVLEEGVHFIGKPFSLSQLADSLKAVLTA